MMKNLIIKVLKWYQVVAPSKIREICCMKPTCSNFMIVSISFYGIKKGLRVGFQRIILCHNKKHSKSLDNQAVAFLKKKYLKNC